MEATASAIRQRILETVSRNGGHLASSLGSVEIAMALAEVFEPARDRVIWDVGHQSYAWKLLTGRADRFDTLRRFGGLSGFPNPSESECDAAYAGHAGTALSVALGMAAARDRRGSGEHVVAVIGDSSIVNGTSFEALNCCAAATRKVIVILNDNDMAISKPSGSFSKFLGRLITGVRYNRVKTAAEAAGHRLKLSFLRGIYHAVESRIKGLFLGNRFFEQCGLRYIGPVDGHDLKALKSAFTVAKGDKGSVLVHVVTKKGKGFAPAERNPTEWHGTGPFDLDSPPDRPAQSDASWSATFGRELASLARRDGRVVALTAAMKDGTGLTEFAREFPNRFFDVGIAEGHLAAFAGGLAAGGMRPFVAVYSTFLQRAVDQVMHDVCLAKLPVVFCVDRAGVVGADGMTHHGVFDVAMLRSLPGLTICQPKDAADLRAMLREALDRDGPTVIRYPRGTCPIASTPTTTPTPTTTGPVIWTTGDWFGKAAAVARRVGGEVVQARTIKPLDERLLARQLLAGRRIVTLENSAAAGGLGAAVLEAASRLAAEHGRDFPAVRVFGWPDQFIPHGTQAELERAFGLDEDSLVAALSEKENMKKEA